MNNILQFPQAIFLYSSIAVALFGFFYPVKGIDLHIHDTYFVTNTKQLFIFLSIVMIFFWMVYVVCRNILLSSVLVWMHFVLLVISILAMAFANKKVYADSSSGSIDLSRYNMVNSIILIGLVFSVLLFLVNIIGGAFRKM